MSPTPADEPPEVVAVVPAYDPGPGLDGLVASLLAQIGRVVVVDDGSPRPVVLGVADPRVTLLRQPTNRGIAAALNTGVRLALGQGAGAVLTVDQDSEPADDLVARLVTAWRDAEASGVRVGVVAPEHVGGQPDQRAGRPPLQSGMLVPAAALREVGELDETLVIDGVDDDFALRCLDAGRALVVAAGAALHHRLGDAAAVRVAGRDVRVTRSATFRYYYLVRNRLRLVRRHGRRHPGWAVRQLVGATGHLVVVTALVPGRRDRLREAGRGARDAFRAEVPPRGAGPS